MLGIPEDGEIGGEVHEGHDQLLYFAAGAGVAKIGETECEVTNGDVSIMPSGVFHNFRNTGPGTLKLFTTYSPARHDLQARPGGREELAPSQRTQAVAQGDPGCKVHRRHRSRQATTSSRRLTQTVTKIR